MKASRGTRQGVSSKECVKMYILPCELKFYSILILLTTDLLSTAFCKSISEDTRLRPQVVLRQGILRGNHFQSREGQTYSGFLGIPFAKVVQRFKPPRPPVQWEGIREATKYGLKCFQLDRVTKKIVGGDNCLFLNVFTPKLSALYPVMVFIHGGSYSSGYSDLYGGKYFMDEKVVLVTLNYRVGAFGFLNANDGKAQGNMGLKDQTMALKWVQENIHHFGGDSHQVTLFGESAGAASVALHILSPLNKGLFKYAISQSGSSLNPWVIGENPELNAKKLADNLNCTYKNSPELVDCLRKTNSMDIVKHQNFMVNVLDSTLYFGPSIETVEIGNEKRFLSEMPYKLLMDGNFNKVPWIATVNEDEGIFFNSAVVQTNAAARQLLNEAWRQISPLTFSYDYKHKTKSAKNYISDMIKEFYFKNQDIGKENYQNLTNCYSDRLFIHGIQATALLHAKHQPVFTAVFSYRGNFSFTTLFGINNIPGVTHGDDLFYLFNSPIWPEFKRGSESEMISKSFIKAWVNFATFGDPKFNRRGITWSPISSQEIRKKEINWLNFNEKPGILVNPFSERMFFWTEIIETELEYGQ